MTKAEISRLTNDQLRDLLIKNRDLGNSDPSQTQKCVEIAQMINSVIRGRILKKLR